MKKTTKKAGGGRARKLKSGKALKALKTLHAKGPVLDPRSPPYRGIS